MSELVRVRPPRAVEVAVTDFARSTLGRLIAIIAAGTLVRAAVAARLPLHFDEMYYWLWAHHPALGYLDQPPMIAYLILLTTRLGDAAIWVRLSSLLLGAATSYVLFLLAREMFDERVGLRAALLFQVVPILWWGSMVAAPEAPLYLAWVVALLLGWQAFHGKPRRWAGLGVAMGLGLLSKFYMVWLGLGIVLHACLCARPWLRRLEPYQGAFIAAVLFLPVVYWNIHHGWANIRFVLHDRPRPQRGVDGFQPLWLALPDLVFLTPAFLWAVWALLSRVRDERFRYLLWTGLPAAAVPILFAPAGMARAHWWGPVCLGLLIVIAACWSLPVRIMAACNAVVLAWVVVLILAVRLTVPPLSFLYFLYGWNDAARRVEHAMAQVDTGTILVTDDYEIAAALSYYGRGTLRVYLAGADPASVWPRFEDARGANGLGITYDAYPWRRCVRHSDEVASEPVELYHRARLFQLYDLFAACP
jgi:4-amino-4-deoxy-L-arabinose transferase-like glycosyltransferase